MSPCIVDQGGGLTAECRLLKQVSFSVILRLGRTYAKGIPTNMRMQDTS